MMRMVLIFWAIAIGTSCLFANELMVNQSVPPRNELKAKRLGPVKIDPVVIGKVRFEVIPWGKERGLKQNGGYIAALDNSSKKELWILKVYDIPYDPALEGDVQDIFIVSMSKAFFSDKLHIKDEKGRKFIVDPNTRTVELK